MTINEACASGLRAVMLVDQMIRVGDAGVAIAGGMENMTRPPYCCSRPVRATVWATAK